MPSDAFADLAAYVALPRLTALALSPDGTRLVASQQQPDAYGAKYVSSLWEIPLDGSEPSRLTRSEQGESAPAFIPDGDLLFTSKRPDLDGEDTDGALWRIGAVGEPVLRLRRAGGVSGPVVARDAGTVLVAGSRLARTVDDAADAERRNTRKDRKISAILHTGMPIRYWDHELGDVSPRLFVADGDTLRDIAPNSFFELVEADYDITADGATAITSWRLRRPRGARRDAIAVIEVATGERRVLEAPAADYSGARIAPDGSRIAAMLEREPDFETSVAYRLALVDPQSGHADTVDLGDLWPSEVAWSYDSRTLLVSGNLHGRGAVVAVDAATAAVTHRLVGDAVYGNLLPAPDGALYALRSTMDAAPHPVRLDVTATDQEPVHLSTPAPTPPLPGRVEELWVDGVHAYLFTPDGDGPHPVMQWIHGGPFMSYNSWSWRWNPWVAVAHGWAVILPDPALSTGYGQDCIDRAWPYLADVVWREIETVLDDVLQRPELDETRTALLGASFGGFMTNWIAGHSDRFAAIVTHAGLWALDQQHATTDAAHYKTGVLGRRAEHPDWYAQNSPHNFVDAISTPMLIVHGNRDYRVPVSEALRLWWDLVSRWDGEPEQLPHRFLQLTGENHWVLSPANAEIWYDSVLGFCGQHVLGRHWEPSDLL